MEKTTSDDNIRVNENCLREVKCPKCGAIDEFFIAGEAHFKVTDDGAEVDGDIHWDGNSFCNCIKCGHSGRLDSFYMNHKLIYVQETHEHGGTSFNVRCTDCGWVHDKPVFENDLHWAAPKLPDVCPNKPKRDTIEKPGDKIVELANRLKMDVSNVIAEANLSLREAGDRLINELLEYEKNRSV